MVDRRVGCSRGHVGHAGNRQHLHSHLSRRNHFRHRGHSHQVRANRPQKTYLRRRFIARPQHGSVHAFAHGNSQPLSRIDRHPAIIPRIRFAHVDEPQPKVRIFRSHQRILPLQVDVVADRHQPPLSILRIDAAGSVRQDCGAHSHARKHSHRKHHAAHRIAFIKMHAPLHHHHRALANVAHHQLARVSNGGGARKMRDIVVADADRLRHLVGKSSQPRSQHNRHRRFDGAL